MTRDDARPHEIRGAWLSDPLRPDRLRFFDGQRWSDDVHDAVPYGTHPDTAGWFPDPLNPHQSRYCDGLQWTEEVRPLEQPPPPGAEPRVPTPDIRTAPHPLEAETTPVIEAQVVEAALEPETAPAGPMVSESPAKTIATAPSAQTPDDLRTTATSIAHSTPEEPHIDASEEDKDRRRRFFMAVVAGAAVIILAAVAVAVTSSLRAPAESASTSAAGIPEAAIASSQSPTRPSATTSAPASTSPTPSPSTSVGSPVLEIATETAETPSWKVSWQTVQAVGLPASVGQRINDLLWGFSDNGASELSQTGAIPPDVPQYRGDYTHTIESVECPEPLLCLLMRGGSQPPGGGSGVGFYETLVLDYTTGETVPLKDYIQEDLLPGLVSATYRNLSSSDQPFYEGIESLEPTYEAFRKYIPHQKGLRLYFSEYEVGPVPVEFFLPWDAITDVSGMDTGGAGWATRFICGSVDPLPPLVDRDSDSTATRALQTVLASTFDLNPGPIDGTYGRATVAAVEQMQQDLGLTPDGLVGPATWNALRVPVCNYD